MTIELPINVEDQIAKAQEQIKRSSTIINNILQQYKIEDLYHANQKVLNRQRKKGQAHNNGEFEHMKQMYNEYKKLNYHKKKREISISKLDQYSSTISETIQINPTFDTQSTTTSDRSNNVDSNQHQIEEVQEDLTDLVEDIPEDDLSTESSQNMMMCANCKRYQIEDSICENIEDDNDFLAFIQVRKSDVNKRRKFRNFLYLETKKSYSSHAHNAINISHFMIIKKHLNQNIHGLLFSGT